MVSRIFIQILKYLKKLAVSKIAKIKKKINKGHLLL